MDSKRYPIPAAQCKEGDNVLAIRLFTPSEKSGFSWQPFVDIGTTRSLIATGWLAKTEFALPALTAEARKDLPQIPSAPDSRNGGARLFNAMIAPLVPVSLAGVVWYQGEQDTGRSTALYQKMLSGLITNWRTHWGASLPFIICQLPNNGAKTADAGPSRWAPKEFADGEAGMKQYQATAALGVRDALYAIDLPGWADNALAALGEAPSVEGLAAAVTQINAVQAALQRIGMAMPQIAAMSDAAITALINAAGGADVLAGGLASFYANYFSEAEKTTVATRMVTDELATLGYAMPSSRDEFRAWVESAIDAGESGAKSAAGLLRLEGAVAAVLPATENAADAIDSLAGALEREQQERKTLASLAQDQHGLWADLAEAQGDHATAAQRRYWIETAGMTAAEQAAYDYNQSIREQIAAANDAAAAVQRASSAMSSLGDTRFDLENELLTLSGNTSEVARRQRERDLAEMSAGLDAEQAAKITAAYDYNVALREQIKAQQDAQAAAEAAAQAQAQASQQAAQAAQQLTAAWQGITDSIFDEVKRIRGITSGNTAASLAGAQSEFAIATAQARAGDQEAAKRLPELSRAMLSLAESSAASLLDLRRIQGRTAASLAQTGGGLAQSYGLKVPAFDVGTNYVPHDMLAMIHKGEAIVPERFNPAAFGLQQAALDPRAVQLLGQIFDVLQSMQAETRSTAVSSASVAKALTRVMTPARDALRTQEKVSA